MTRWMRDVRNDQIGLEMDYVFFLRFFDFFDFWGGKGVPAWEWELTLKHTYHPIRVQLHVATIQNKTIEENT